MTTSLRIALSLIIGTVPTFAADLKPLPGHVPGILSRLTAKGPLPETNQLWLAIGVQMRDRQGLSDFVRQVSDPASPGFRQYLTREELTARFGPTEQDYEMVKSFARSNNLSVAVTHPNRLLLDVTGSPAAIEKAFHVALRTYRHPTEARDFFAPDSEPAVDAALPVADVQGFTDYWLPHPKNAWRKDSHDEAKLGTSPDGSGYFFGDDFRVAYVPGTTLTGAGQTVGLFEFTGFWTNDIFNYANAAGGGRTNIIIQPVLVNGFSGKVAANADVSECEGDIEMVMAMAPGLSKIVAYEEKSTGPPNDILNTMLAATNVLVFSCSWGWNGPDVTTDAIFESMDAIGQTFLDASGDVGAFTAGSNSVNGVENTNTFNTPASNPAITQVGGTTLRMKGLGASWGSEVVWNWGLDKAGDYYNSGASSGGISSYYTIPYWQTNVADLASVGGSTSYRNIPDVSANADNDYLVYNNGDTNGDIYFGGTSYAAPLWAGFIALVNEQSAAQGGKSVGFINPALYALAATTNYNALFHDVIHGSNSWPASPDLFYAATNYDLCTGLGSMNGTNLINALAALQDIGPAPSFLPPAMAANGFTLSWSTVPGKSYQAQYEPALGAANWVNFGAAMVASNSVASISDSFTNSRRFYRVILLP